MSKGMFWWRGWCFVRRRRRRVVVRGWGGCRRLVRYVSDVLDALLLVADEL
jgi:hypothetical protein